MVSDEHEDLEREAEVYRLAAEMHANGRRSRDIRKALEALGVTSESARDIVEQYRPSGEKTIPEGSAGENGHEGRSNAGLGEMLSGAAWLTIGIGVTVVSYLGADRGGFVVVAYGAVIVGVLQFLRGVITRSREAHGRNVRNHRNDR